MTGVQRVSSSPIERSGAAASISWDLSKVKTVAASVFKGAFAGMIAGAAIGAGTGAAIGFTASILVGGLGAIPGAIKGAVIVGAIGLIAGAVLGFRSGREEVMKQAENANPPVTAQSFDNSSKMNDSEFIDENSITSGYEGSSEGEEVNSMEGVDSIIELYKNAINAKRKLTPSEREFITENYKNDMQQKLLPFMNQYYEVTTEIATKAGVV